METRFGEERRRGRSDASAVVMRVRSFAARGIVVVVLCGDGIFREGDVADAETRVPRLQSSAAEMSAVCSHRHPSARPSTRYSFPRARGSTPGRMSETAEERKKRLRAMRDEAETVEPELKFRNYLPRDEALQEGLVRARARA